MTFICHDVTKKSRFQIKINYVAFNAKNRKNTQLNKN